MRVVDGAQFNVDTELQIKLNFDFVEHVSTAEYRSLTDIAFTIIFIMAIVLICGFALISIMNLASFYSNLQELINRRYKDAKDWHQVDRHLKKFRKIHSALDGMDQYKKVLAQLNVYLEMDWSNLTYEEMRQMKSKIEILDQMLPNLDDLEISSSKFQLSEVEKAKQLQTEEILKRRA